MNNNQIACRLSSILPGSLIIVMYSIAIISLNLILQSCGGKNSDSASALKSTGKHADGSGAYKTGIYRNLFMENGHSTNEILNRTETTYQQLFHGDTATQALYFDAGNNENGPLAYIYDLYDKDVRSEGIGYGMMIAVQMDKKADFDAIWNWAMTYMYIASPDHPSEGYFSWSLKRDGTQNSETPATDGEEYIIMALYFASGRWGDQTGIYNYRFWADKILTTMRHHPLKYGPTRFSGNKIVYSMVNEELKLIRFGPQYDDFAYTDPSYMLPAFYDLWAKFGPIADRSFWADVADSTRSFFRKTTNPQTGLAPNFANFDGTPVRGNRSSWEAIRTMANWAVDWSWWQKDSYQQELSNRTQSFYYSKGIDAYGVGYTLDGELAVKTHTKVLVAINAIVSLAATHGISKDFTEALWNTPIPSAHNERYYEGLWYNMAMLHCSGAFRIWKPKQ
jgi:oligosaccharide reducing-end xylanase